LRRVTAQPPFWMFVIAFVCALGPLIFIHELGHYLVGRWFGVGAEAFSIGFGREIAGWTDKRGTRWKVGWLPLGGYVRFVGDMNPASAPASPDAVPPELRSRSFHFKPVWQRFLVVLAGPAANMLLAILIVAGFFTAYGVPSTPSVAPAIQQGSAAQRAGIRRGDHILSVAGQSTARFEDLRRVVSLRPGEQVRVVIERDGARRSLPVTIGSEDRTDEFGQTHRVGVLGVAPPPRVYTPVSIVEALPAAAVQVFVLTRSMVDGIVQILTGQRSTKDLGGPLKIAQIAGQQASLGPFEFIQLVALISINLGFINLLPVPMLDGGHLLFYGLEAIRKRPVSVRAQEWAFRGGLAALLALMVFTTFNDLGSFGLWERLERLIG